MTYQKLAYLTYTEDNNKKFILCYDRENNQMFMMDESTFDKDGFNVVSNDNCVIQKQEERKRNLKTKACYMHHKEKRYFTLYQAYHIEEKRDYAIYVSIDEPYNEIWARPLDMFLEKVLKGNELVYRFEEM